MLAALEHERGAVEEQLVARRTRRGPSASSTIRPDRARLEELEAERPAALRHRLELLRRRAPLLLEPADLRELRLRLLRLRLLVAEPRHEPLEPLDVVRDPVELRRRRRRAGRLLATPRVPGAVEEERLRPAELEHRGRHGLEEPAVVRDEDHGRVERGELALEPLEALDVEVVRRLVEQQQVGVGRERAGERGAGQLSAGERVERAVEVGVREPEPADDRRGAVAPGPAACVLEPRLRLAVAPQRRGVRGRRPPSPARAAGARPRSRRGRRRPRASTRAGVSPWPRGGRWSWSATRVSFANASSPPWSEVSPMIARSSVVFPAPFGPGEREPVATAQAERDPVEEGVAGELLAQPGCDQDGHARKGADEPRSARDEGKERVSARHETGSDSHMAIDPIVIVGGGLAAAQARVRVPRGRGRGGASRSSPPSPIRRTTAPR